MREPSKGKSCASLPPRQHFLIPPGPSAGFKRALLPVSRGSLERVDSKIVFSTIFRRTKEANPPFEDGSVGSVRIRPWRMSREQLLSNQAKIVLLQ